MLPTKCRFIWPIRNKNCLWRPCLLIDRVNMNNLQRGPSIYSSYHASVHIAVRFQRRSLKCERLTDDGRWTPSDDKSSHCLWQGELKRGGVHIKNYHQIICHSNDDTISFCYKSLITILVVMMMMMRRRRRRRRWTVMMIWNILRMLLTI